MTVLSRLLFPAAVVLALSSSACGKTAEQALGSVNDNGVFKYDVTTFTVKAGQKVHVTMKNNETMANMFHNFVLVKPGTEAAVATAGITAGETLGYVKAGDPNVIAQTPLSKPGQPAEVTFTAPEKGTYPYICTFPGHYTTMKGTLVVTD